MVTNVNSDTWASQYENFSTLGDDSNTDILKQKLPTPYPLTDMTGASIEGHIPMQGGSEDILITSSTQVDIPVERMYAKLKVRVILDRAIVIESSAEVEGVSFENIPWYCQVSTLYNNDEDSQDDKYPTDGDYDWITRSVGKNNENDPNNEDLPEGETYDYVIYMPENIQGEKENQEKDDDLKIEIAPEHASILVVKLNYVDDEGVQAVRDYIMYPGGNNYNNFNIRRNKVYRVTMELGYPIEDVYTASANCLVAKPGTKISFEPYNREETGGDFYFSDYLSPGVEGKEIKSIQILWQTQDCIGNNSKGDLVYFEPGDPQTIHDKIYVTTNAPGNAVIAAYNEEDCQGDIIWSWHIWVTSEDPTNVANAVVYYTYDWGSDGIYADKNRVPGYGVMPCNLGSLQSNPSANTIAGRIPTYGLMYQWGRKDPFPGLVNGTETTNITYGNYDDDTAQYVYDNSNNQVHITDQEDEGYLFHSISGNTIISAPENYGIEYAIAHPTHFMCGTYLAGTTATNGSDSYYNNQSLYHNTGDWLPNGQSNDRLWGASEVTSDTKSYYIGNDNFSYERYLRDDYGEKSIFDPCPNGWRVSPPDQWLGFTDTGLNPKSSMDEVNYDSNNSGSCGMTLYIQAWRSGLTSFFPMQGMISPDGGGSHNRNCGNYHNATADTGNRVNILHIHNDYKYFRIFEISYCNYYIKSVAGPIRCVRDTR